MRWTHGVQVLLLSLAMLPASVAGAVGAACEVCGQMHQAQAPAYVTDWETNVLHRIGSLDCALESMRTRYTWSRAAVADNSTGERITITRAQGRWTVRPEEAVVLVRAPQTEGGCASHDFYNSRDEFLRYAKKHRKTMQAGPPPERLADYVDAFVARHGGVPAPQPTPTSSSPPERPQPGWTGNAVETVKSEGIMEGYPDGSFRGDGEVTRYEMAVIAQRLLRRVAQQREPNAEAPAGGPDMGASPQTQELVKALEDDLTAAGANRGEVAAALKVLNDAAAQGITVPPAIATDTDWPDVPTEHWAHDAVREVTRAGIMNGYPDNTFQGTEPLTRYEIAVIAARLLARAAETAPSSPASLAEGQESTTAQTSLPAPLPEGETTTPAEAEATAELSREARAHLLGLKAQLMLSGMTEEAAAQVLEPVKNAMQKDASAGEPVKAPSSEAAPQEKSESAEPAGQTQETQASLPSAPSTTAAEPERTHPKVTEPNMLGVSGFLLTPSADTNDQQGTLKLGISRALGSNLIYGNTSALWDTEVSLLSTSGDLPSRLLLNAKRQIWRSSDGRSRLAVGVLDATDEIDTTLYGAYSKSFRSRLWSDEPRDWTLTVGLGGGELLDGIFGSVYVPLNERLAVGAEVIDLGDSGNQLNYGMEYNLGRGWHFKGGIVDGELAAGASVERDF